MALPTNVEALVITGNANVNLTGTKGANAMAGNGGINTITGGAGDDVVDGGGGADSLVGGAGDDTYLVDDVADTVVEDAGGGNDTVIFIDTDLDLNDLTNIENGTVQGNGNVGIIGDGFADLIVGARGANAGAFIRGAAYVVFGTDTPPGLLNLDTIAGSTGGFKIKGAQEGDEIGFSVDGAGDVNGDGFDDVIVGTRLAHRTGFYGGAAYVVFGRDLEGMVTHQGSAADDALVGDGGANILVGGQGDDTLDGGAGGDVLVGGAGNDILVFDSADVRRVDGGGGFDTLLVDGTGVTVDLTAINATVHFTLYDGIDAIDLTGSGANSLTLEFADLLTMAKDTNVLRVDGDADDTIATGDTGWGVGVADADIAGYTTYTNGGATLIVDSDITQTGVQA